MSTRVVETKEYAAAPDRIAILAINYPPEPTGNAPYTGSLASALRARGSAVSVTAAHPHYPEWRIRAGYGQWSRRENVAGVPVHRVLHYVPQTPRGVRRLFSEITFGLRLLVANWSGPHVVLGVSPALFSTWIASLRLRLTPRRPRFVVWVQDIYSLGLAETGEGSRVVAAITKRVERSTMRAADRVVVIHQRFADYLIEHLGIPAERIEVIRNWTHLSPSELIPAADAKASLGWPADVTLAVHTGNIGAKQGLENILDAARLADEREEPVLFLLVGDGGERTALEARASGIERLRFIDPLDDVAYRYALSAADVLILNEKPGVAAMALPSKLTSYLDAGRPLVAATDPAGIAASEVIASGSGVVVQSGEPARLLDAVLAIREDPEAAAGYGASGRAYRETVLDQAVAHERWASLIDSLVAR